jgi:hypothetical protein
VVDILAVEHTQNIARDSMLAQEFIAVHYLAVGGLPSLGKAVAVVHLLWAVQADSYGETLSGKKTTPVLINERAIGLNPVDDLTVRGPMLALQFNDLMKVLQTQQGGFPAVPGKTDHWIRGGLNVLNDVLFQDIIRHAKGLLIRVEALFFQVVTVVTIEVTDGANRFSKNLIRAGGFDHGAIHHSESKKESSHFFLLISEFLILRAANFAVVSRIPFSTGMRSMLDAPTKP